MDKIIKNNQMGGGIKLILIIIVIVSLLLFAFNQFFSWYYKAELLKGPCDLCLDLNPHLELYPKDLLLGSNPGIKEIKNIIIKSP